MSSNKPAVHWKCDTEGYVYFESDKPKTLPWWKLLLLIPMLMCCGMTTFVAMQMWLSVEQAFVLSDFGRAFVPICLMATVCAAVAWYSNLVCKD